MPSQYGRLALDDGNRVKVFRAIDDRIRSDKTIQRIFMRPHAIVSWRGKPDDKRQFAIDEMPALVLTPRGSRENYWYPGATKGDLTVQYDLYVPGLCADDVENLNALLTDILIPHCAAEGVFAWHKTLKDAGAETGLITMSQPAYDPKAGDAGSDGYFQATGYFALSVRTTPRKEMT